MKRTAVLVSPRVPRLAALAGVVAIAVSLGLSAEMTQAANIAPFTETFGDAAGDGFDLEPWIDDTVGYNFAVNGNGELEATLADGFRSYSIVETSGVPSGVGTSVSVSVDFTLTDDDLATTRLGLAMFGTQNFIEQSGPDPESYLVYIAEPGGFSTPSVIARNVQTGDSAFGPDFTTFTGALTGTTFNLSVDATIGATDLTFDYVLSDLVGGGTDSGQVVLPLASAPLGDFFGVTVDRNSSGPDSVVTFDNYSVSFVPEPACMLLLGLGATHLAARRRRC